MTAEDQPDTEELLRRTGHGDARARDQLLTRHLKRLRQMVSIHLDPRLAARADPSDVVQEALMDASQKLSDYLRRRPLPFYPWLRQLAWERLLQLHRRHLRAQARTVTREERHEPALPDESVLELARRLVSSLIDSGDSEKAMSVLRTATRTHELVAWGALWDNVGALLSTSP